MKNNVKVWTLDFGKDVLYGQSGFGKLPDEIFFGEVFDHLANSEETKIIEVVAFKKQAQVIKMESNKFGLVLISSIAKATRNEVLFFTNVKEENWNIMKDKFKKSFKLN